MPLTRPIGNFPQKRRKKYGDYTTSQKERAVALAEAEKNVEYAGEITGIPADTIRYWRNSGMFTTAQVQAAAGDLSKELEVLAWDLAGLAREKFNKASLSQVAHALGVAVDKSQLLRNPSGNNPNNAPLTREQALDRLKMYLQDSVRDTAIDVVPEDADSRRQAAGSSTSCILDPTSLTLQKEGGEGVQQVGSPGRDTVEQELLEVTSQETSGLLSGGEEVGVT